MAKGRTLAEVPPPFCAGRVRDGITLDRISFKPVWPVWVSWAGL